MAKVNYEQELGPSQGRQKVKVKTDPEMPRFQVTLTKYTIETYRLRTQRPVLDFCHCFLIYLFCFVPDPPSAEINSFVLIALHSEPPQAVTEMNQLHDVFLEVIKKWDNKVRKPVCMSI